MTYQVVWLPRSFSSTAALFLSCLIHADLLSFSSVSVNSTIIIPAVVHECWDISDVHVVASVWTSALRDLQTRRHLKSSLSSLFLNSRKRRPSSNTPSTFSLTLLFRCLNKDLAVWSLGFILNLFIVCVMFLLMIIKLTQRLQTLIIFIISHIHIKTCYHLCCNILCFTSHNFCLAWKWLNWLLIIKLVDDSPVDHVISGFFSWCAALSSHAAAPTLLLLITWPTSSPGSTSWITWWEKHLRYVHTHTHTHTNTHTHTHT